MIVDRRGGKAAFLDRDGVLTRAYVDVTGTRPARTWDEVEPLPGALGSVEILRRKGYDIVIVTNQPDVRRGVVSPYFGEAVNDRVKAFFGAALYACYHDERDACDCRKPMPGLIVRAAADRLIDRSRSILIGDRITDFQAAERAGVARPFLVMVNDPDHLRRIVEAL